MIEISNEFKEKVITALLESRSRFDGSDNAFAKQWSINNAVYSRLKNGEREGLLKEMQWLSIGRELGVTLNERKWKMAKTEVYNLIEEDITYCQKNSKAMILTDDVGIGKSYAAKYLSKTLKNCFYVDCKQAKSKQAFIRLLAKTIGVDNTGRYIEVKENLKYYIKMLPNTMIITDDSGYLEYPAYMELLELWDATENCCGWYQIGDDSLREKLERGITHKKVGYKAIFSRYSKKYSTIIPSEPHEKRNFYKKLIYDVISINCEDKTIINKLVNQCLITDDKTSYGDLRRAETLILLQD